MIPSPLPAPGFSLNELLIVLLIVGILALVGAPNYLGHIRQGERARAITVLNDILLAAEEFRIARGAYPTGLGTGSGEMPYAFPADSSYVYAIPPDTDPCGANCITITATVNPEHHSDDDCHVLSLDTLGRRFEQVKDGTTRQAAADCW